MLTSLFIAVLIFLIFKWLYTKLHFWQNQNVPTPNLWKQWVATWNMFTRRHSEVYNYDEFYRQYKKTDSWIGIYQMVKPTIALLDPELVKDVMITNFKHFHDNGFGEFMDKESDPIFGRNPFMLKGEEWKEKRNEIVPALSPAKIKSMYPLIDNSCQQMTTWMKKNIKEGEPLDGRELAAKFTTDVVSSCIFANDSGVFTQETSEIREFGKKMMAPNMWAFFQMILFSIFPSLSKLKKIRFFGPEITDYFEGLMKSAVAYRKQNGIHQDDYLEHLIQLKEKKGITEIDMAAHGATFFVDGYETSSLAIVHTLLEISRSERIQTKLRKLINEAYEKHGKLDYDIINDIPYLEQCFNEALRLYPPAPMTQRQCNEAIDFVTRNGVKFRVKEEMPVFIPFWSIQRDPDYYNEPEEFIPERFNPENGGVKGYIDKCLFMPFGQGPRACLGQRFAYAQSKACIAELVRKFELTMDERTKYPLVIDPAQFLNFPIGGIWINFKPIQK